MPHLVSLLAQLIIWWTVRYAWDKFLDRHRKCDFLSDMSVEGWTESRISLRPSCKKRECSSLFKTATCLVEPAQGQGLGIFFLWSPDVWKEHCYFCKLGISLIESEMAWGQGLGGTVALDSENPTLPTIGALVISSTASLGSVCVPLVQYYLVTSPLT